MKNVFIILLNFNRTEITKECLTSLEKLSLSNLNLDIVVVDNASKEPFTLQEKEFQKLKIKVIRNEDNLGFSGGMNKGIKYAQQNSADYVVILNNDTIVDKNLIQELVSAAETNPMIGLVAAKIYFAKGYEYHKDKYKEHELGNVFWYAGGYMDWANIVGIHRGVDEVDNGQYDKAEYTEFASGCCMLITKKILKEVGLLREEYFLYYEDSDYNERVKQLGYKILYNPKAVLWHKNAGSTGGSGSKLQDYFISRNRMLFGFRFASLRTKVALFRESARILVNGREWQKNGIRDFYMRRFGKGSYKV